MPGQAREAAALAVAASEAVSLTVAVSGGRTGPAALAVAVLEVVSLAVAACGARTGLGYDGPQGSLNLLLGVVACMSWNVCCTR